MSSDTENIDNEVDADDNIALNVAVFDQHAGPSSETEGKESQKS